MEQQSSHQGPPLGDWLSVLKQCLGRRAERKSPDFAEELKAHYRDNEFSLVPSFVGHEEYKHVKSMDSQMVLLQEDTNNSSPHSHDSAQRICTGQVQQPKSPITLEELSREEQPILRRKVRFAGWL